MVESLLEFAVRDAYYLKYGLCANDLLACDIQAAVKMIGPTGTIADVVQVLKSQEIAAAKKARG